MSYSLARETSRLWNGITYVTLKTRHLGVFNWLGRMLIQFLFWLTTLGYLATTQSCTPTPAKIVISTLWQCVLLGNSNFRLKSDSIQLFWKFCLNQVSIRHYFVSELGIRNWTFFILILTLDREKLQKPKQPIESFYCIALLKIVVEKITPLFSRSHSVLFPMVRLSQDRFLVSPSLSSCSCCCGQPELDQGK